MRGFNSQRCAARQSVTIFGGGEVTARLVTGLQSHTTVLFRTDGGLGGDGVSDTIELHIDVSEAHGRLLIGQGGEVGIERSLSLVHGGLGVDHSLLLVCVRSGRSGSGR